MKLVDAVKDVGAGASMISCDSRKFLVRPFPPYLLLD